MLGMPDESWQYQRDGALICKTCDYEVATYVSRLDTIILFPVGSLEMW